MSYRIETGERFTIIYTDQHGVEYDLNSEGWQCSNLTDLEGLVWDLWVVKGISWQVRDDLLEDIADYYDSLED